MSGMSASGLSERGGSPPPEQRERGARRRKLAGYLKAANELRQSYQQSYLAPRGQRDPEVDENGAGIPGAFPDVDIVRSGDEEMVLFPSYARRHVKKKPRAEPGTIQEDAGSGRDSRDTSGAGDAEFWRREWEKYEDDSAIVDVDVRGWIYSPQRGPMTRRNRLLIGLARQLSGIPAPSSSRPPSGPASPTSSRPTSPTRERSRTARRDEDLVSKEAEEIMKRGEGEADVAGRGGYSEDPSDSDLGARRRQSSQSPQPGHIIHPLTDSSLNSNPEKEPAPGYLSKATSWGPSTTMNPAELGIANAHLMARLKPFMTTPLAATPITVFFFDDETSRSRTIVTNDSGHFNIRAALDFVPTSVRVLASENLSATAEVRIIEPTGVSLISDIDDTIKHSAIGGGAREMFRNTFVRDLKDLTVDGVKEWYQTLSSMGVQMHYVSNAPWQLYPVISTFFAMAGLPSGSYHLKQYSGMLQGIFEPVAERKKGTLEKLLADFPQRKFILVGDSGEADLEVYTDTALAHPGRIIGIFIRDVTTPPSKGFFDSSPASLSNVDLSSGLRDGRSSSVVGVEPPQRVEPLRRSPQRKPVLPPRPSMKSAATTSTETQPAMGKLIDLDEDDPSFPSPPRRVPLDSRSMTDIGFESRHRQDAAGSLAAKGKSRPPPPPAKPLALRSPGSSSSADDLKPPAKKVPPPPPKPRNSSRPLEIGEDETQVSSAQSGDFSQLGNENSAERQGYRSSVRQKVASAYNSMPSASSYWYGTQSQDQDASRRTSRLSSRRSSRDSLSAVSDDGSSKPPPPPPRKPLTSYPAEAAQYASSTISNTWNGSNYESDSRSANYPQQQQQQQPINKKEELWKRRWVRAKQILDRKGILLRSWRVGGDAMTDAVKLVERETRRGKDEREKRGQSV
ncbi:MAG: hypothetical protein M1819_004423 [Sarea resinae]|nr:MAG: hypothetical protein M1819_004423 [Sarea resinae]